MTAEPAQDVHVEAGGHQARATLWPETVHQVEGRRVGFIGKFSAETPEAGEVVLRLALERLREAGVELAIGPLDGSTWRNYRLVTGTLGEGGAPPFLMEPVNPAWYPAVWEAAGFTVLSRYYSSLVEDLTRRDPKVARARQRLDARGLRLETLDPARWDALLAEVHALSLIAFTPNFLYEPLALSAFQEMYAKARPLTDPALVLLAWERGGALAGYCFALPDPTQPGTVIVKTLAVLPGREHAGLGAVLLEELHLRAAAAGHTRAIHALMHEGNRSRNLSGHYGQPFREYALYQCTL